MGKTKRISTIPNAAAPLSYVDLAHHRAAAERHRAEAVAWAIAGMSQVVGRLVTGKRRGRPL
ncbi:MAG: hypothetical protein RIM84_00345 [Alphaproteobacteria bacterium]